MNSSDSLASFLDKFRARWPEWAVAEAFVPHTHHASAVAWFALLQELTDAAWGGSDPQPGEAKLGWWQEELAGWTKGARRHPLGQPLQSRPAPWMALAGALPALPASRERAGDIDEAFEVLAPFASSVLAVEAVLFESAADDGDALRAISAGLLQSRFLHPGDELVPLAVLAQAGEGGEAERRRLWAAQLHGHWPRATTGSRPRRIRGALAHARLGRRNPAEPLPAWKALFVAWRAARG
jgi:hypothetical protein